MRKFLFILIGLFTVSTLVFVSCSKSDNNSPSNNNNNGNNNNGNDSTGNNVGCPDGYFGINCQMPWNLSVSGAWKDEGGNLVAITVSTTNPKAFIVKNYFRGYGIFSEPPVVDVIGSMSDSMSFTLQPTDLQYYADSLLSGNGTVDPSGLKITGSYIKKYVQVTGVDQQGTYYYDTLTTTTNYTWTKQ